MVVLEVLNDEVWVRYLNRDIMKLKYLGQDVLAVNMMVFSASQMANSVTMLEKGGLPYTHLSGNIFSSCFIFIAVVTRFYLSGISYLSVALLHRSALSDLSLSTTNMALGGIFAARLFFYQ